MLFFSNIFGRIRVKIFSTSLYQDTCWFGPSHFKSCPRDQVINKSLKTLIKKSVLSHNTQTVIESIVHALRIGLLRWKGIKYYQGGTRNELEAQ